MKSIKINLRGRGHTSEGKECEDAIFINEEQGVYCLADGVSNASFGKEGAEKLVKDIGTLFCNPGTKNAIEHNCVDVVRKDICAKIQESLKQLNDKFPASKLDDFASTFLACVRTSNENITIIHAGDGAVFAQPNTEGKITATVISYPDNAPNGSVYAAGDEDQVHRMRVFRLKASDYKKIILSTDGFSEAYLVPYNQSFDAHHLAEVFEARTNKDLEELVKRRHIEKVRISDDISCIIYNTDEFNYSNIRPMHIHNNKSKSANKRPPINDEPKVLVSKQKESKQAVIERKKKEFRTVMMKMFVCLMFMLMVFILATSFFEFKQDTLNTISELQNEISSLSKQISEINIPSDEIVAEYTINNYPREHKPIDENSVYFGKTGKDLAIQSATSDKAVTLLENIAYIEYGKAGSSLQMVSRCTDFTELAQLDETQWSQIPAFLDTLTPVQLDYLTLRVVDTFQGALKIANREDYIMDVLTETLGGIDSESYQNCTEIQAIRLMGYLFELFEERNVAFDWVEYNVEELLYY